MITPNLKNLKWSTEMFLPKTFYPNSTLYTIWLNSTNPFPNSYPIQKIDGKLCYIVPNGGQVYYEESQINSPYINQIIKWAILNN